MKKHDAYKRVMRTSVGDKKVTKNSWTQIKARKMRRGKEKKKKSRVRTKTDRSETLPAAGVQETDFGLNVH